MTHIINLTCTRLFSLSQFKRLYQSGCKNRHTTSTKINPNSSRSHGILQIFVRYPLSGKEHTSKVNIIDLCGNENSKKAETTGVKFIETGHINSSLFTLHKVIRAVATKEVYNK